VNAAPGARPAAQAGLDLTALARRAAVAIAAGAGLVGLLSGRPLLTVAWRAGLILVVGLAVIALASRWTRRGGAR
jgi:hypothetical protein